MDEKEKIAEMAEQIATEEEQFAIEDETDVLPATDADTAEAPAGAADASGHAPHTQDEGATSSTGPVPISKKPPALPKKPPKTKEQLEYEAARREHFKTYYWSPILRPIVALVAICIVTSLLLGLTNALTQPIIAENTRVEAEAGRRALLPEADTFEEISTEGLGNVTAIYKATNGTGWVIEAFGKGYGGNVPVMVAFDESGTIIGVTFMENSETVGLGQKVREPGFADQFIGLSPDNVSLGDIDKIASATISTGAAVNAVNAAIEAYNKQVGNATLPTSPEAVRNYLLPGEVLVPITITAENVQPTAWVSDKGNFIIYGVKPGEGEYGSDVTAAVAMDADGVILNLWIDTSGESEQYGQTLATNRAFLDSFLGLTAPVQVDAVADITNSSNSVMQAVNTALAALPLAKEAA